MAKPQHPDPATAAAPTPVASAEDLAVRARRRFLKGVAQVGLAGGAAATTAGVAHAAWGGATLQDALGSFFQDQYQRMTPDEIAARCHALLRRPREMRTDWDPIQPSTVTLGPLSIDTGRHEIRLDGLEIPATRIEFSLLEHLCRRPTEVASRQDLLVSVWGPNWVGDTHVVDVHLSNLRRKLDKVAPDLRIVHTVRGVGFRISNELLDAAEALAGSGAALRADAPASADVEHDDEFDGGVEHASA
jgi:DNA-binding winged helix-turn-helix (wHTH) protein